MKTYIKSILLAVAALLLTACASTDMEVYKIQIEQQAEIDKERITTTSNERMGMIELVKAVCSGTNASSEGCKNITEGFKKKQEFEAIATIVDKSKGGSGNTSSMSAIAKPKNAIGQFIETVGAFVPMVNAVGGIASTVYNYKNNTVNQEQATIRNRDNNFVIINGQNRQAETTLGGFEAITSIVPNVVPQ
jgi:hypothetical protein